MGELLDEVHHVLVVLEEVQDADLDLVDDSVRDAEVGLVWIEYLSLDEQAIGLVWVDLGDRRSQLLGELSYFGLYCRIFLAGLLRMLAIVTKQLRGEPKALDDRYVIGPFDE